MTDLDIEYRRVCQCLGLNSWKCLCDLVKIDVAIVAKDYHLTQIHHYHLTATGGILLFSSK